MTRYEFFSLHAKILSVMKNNGMSIDDFCNVAIYDDYQKMREDKDLKVQYILATIADKYHCGIRTIYTIVNRMEREIQL